MTRSASFQWRRGPTPAAKTLTALAARSRVRGIIFITAVAAVLIVAIPQPEARSPQSAPRPEFRGGVDVVRLDVSVLDNQRRPVEGLKASDFTVLEDGKPRPIVAFTEVRVPAPPVTTPAAAWTRDVAPDVVSNQLTDEARLLVIGFDETIWLRPQGPRAADRPIGR